MARNDIWVVCPHRLLAARYSDEGLPPVNYGLQKYECNLLISAGMPRGMDIALCLLIDTRHASVARIRLELDTGW